MEDRVFKRKIYSQMAEWKEALRNFWCKIQKIMEIKKRQFSHNPREIIEV